MGKKWKKSRNTRGKQYSASASNNLAAYDRALFYLLDLERLRAYSFLGLIFLKTCSQLIHTCLPFVPAAGLRLEIVDNSDKKKSELYFSFSVKKFLTKKAKRACPKQQNFVLARDSRFHRRYRHFLCCIRLVMYFSAPDSTCRGF